MHRPETMWRGGNKVAICKPRREVRRNQLPWHINLRLSGSRAMRRYSSVCLSSLVWGIVYGSSSKLRHQNSVIKKWGYTVDLKTRVFLREECIRLLSPHHHFCIWLHHLLIISRQVSKFLWLTIRDRFLLRVLTYMEMYRLYEDTTALINRIG